MVRLSFDAWNTVTIAVMVFLAAVVISFLLAVGKGFASGTLGNQLTTMFGGNPDNAVLAQDNA
jgi:hypothetical protein